jgi:endonuclease/exonuclease/phosphatase family metal-dependent hydrolase
MRVWVALLLGALLTSGEVVIVSQNLWFDDASGVAGRYARLADRLRAAQPDIVLLQEVTPAGLAALRAGLGPSYGCFPEQPAEGYGNHTLARWPIDGGERLVLPSRMGRVAIIATVQVAGRPLTTVNVHLESMREDGPRRAMQLAAIAQRLAGRPHVLGGDLNFGDGEAEESALAAFADPGWAGGEAPYDPVGNALAARTRFPDEPPRRLDRILLPADGQPLAFQVLRHGESDHHGVLVRLAW